MLRQLERWLHQHIFKVGWLLTKNFNTTTILYYTFFLPGILAYEIVYWLAAGVLNVRADRAIALPEKQEVGELRLTFVKLSKKAPAYKVNLIKAAPLITGVIAIWWITTYVIDVSAALQQASAGTFDAITSALNTLLATPDFWLWAYVGFTLGNTMMPDVTVLRMWRWLIWPTLGVVIILFALGIGEDIVGSTLAGPVTNALNVLSTAFVFIVVLDLIAVAILGAIEALIERITGDSATFKNGKMVVMTRAEAIAERQKERERQRQLQKKPTQPASTPVLTSGTPSIYKLTLPIPGAPGQEPISRQPANLIEPSGTPALPGEIPPERIQPDIIPGQAKPAPRPMPVFGGTAALRSAQDDENQRSEERPTTGDGNKVINEVTYEDVNDADYADADDRLAHHNADNYDDAVEDDYEDEMEDEERA